jgi:hypothetical protein
MKEYQKPEIELISLVAQEKITISDDIIDASMGLQPVPPGLWD